MSHFKCVLCDAVYTDTELQDVIVLSKSRSGKMVRFKDGSVHDIHHLSPGTHSRWHSRFGIANYPGCHFCRLDREKLEQEKLEHETQSDSRQEETVPPPIGKPQDSDSSGGGAVVENVVESEAEPVSPEEPRQSSDRATLGWAFRRSR